MARRSYQKGYVFPRKSSGRVVHVLRYRIRNASGEWVHRAETVDVVRRKDAERLLADRVRAVNGGAKLPSEITFTRFVETNWEAYLKQNLKPSTEAAHRSNTSKHLTPVFGPRQLADITAAEVQQLLEEKRKAGLSAKSLLNLYALLHRMFKLAMNLELITSNPVDRVPKPRVEQREKPVFTPEQVRAITNAVPENLRALLVVVNVTGLRIGEVLGIKWQDVEFETNCLRIRRSIWKGQEQSPKTKQSRRTKPLGVAMRNALLRHKELSCFTKPEDYVFSTGAGKPLDPDDLRKRVLYPAMVTAKVERTMKRAFGFHMFRHTSGSVVQEKIGDLKKTQAFMGHSSITTTGNTYVHLMADADERTISELENELFPELCSTVLKTKEQKSPQPVN